MARYFPAACWALLMVAFAVLARLGLADRDAVITTLMVMPILAFVSIQRGSRCAAPRGNS